MVAKQRSTNLFHSLFLSFKVVLTTQTTKGQLKCEILSDIQPYNNPSKPVYKYRVWVSEDGLKRRHKVFKVKSTALDFINQSKAWNKGIDISSAESGEKQGFSALITPTRAANTPRSKKFHTPKNARQKSDVFFAHTFHTDTRRRAAFSRKAQPKHDATPLRHAQPTSSLSARKACSSSEQPRHCNVHTAHRCSLQQPQSRRRISPRTRPLRPPRGSA